MLLAEATGLQNATVKVLSTFLPMQIDVYKLIVDYISHIIVILAVLSFCCFCCSFMFFNLRQGVAEQFVMVHFSSSLWSFGVGIILFMSTLHMSLYHYEFLTTYLSL